MFLPALFTLFVIAARAWVDALPEDAEPQAGEDISSPSLDFLPPFQPASASQELAPPSGYASCDAEADRAAACDGIKLETLAFVALCRAARAGWALVLRALRPETGDGAAVAVTVTSLCSVAFIALPVFRALEDAERTYQVRVARRRQVALIFSFMYACIVITEYQSIDQPGKVANPARGQLGQDNGFCSVYYEQRKYYVL